MKRTAKRGQDLPAVIRLNSALNKCYQEASLVVDNVIAPGGIANTQGPTYPNLQILFKRDRSKLCSCAPAHVEQFQREIERAAAD